MSNAFLFPSVDWNSIYFHFKKSSHSIALKTNARKSLRLLYSTAQQLPTPTWAANEDECKKLFQWYKDRGLPVPIGGNFNGVSLKRRIAKW